jgi:hypothetical protein
VKKLDFQFYLSENAHGTSVHVVFDDGATTEMPLNLPMGASREKQLRLAYLMAETAAQHRLLSQRIRAAQERIDALSKEAPVEPPRLAEHLVSFLAPKNTAQALLGDMQEIFQKNLRRLGEKEAQRLYWTEVRASAGKWVFDWLLRIGFFTAVIDYFRSKFGL